MGRELGKAEEGAAGESLVVGESLEFSLGLGKGVYSYVTEGRGMVGDGDGS